MGNTLAAAQQTEGKDEEKKKEPCDVEDFYYRYNYHYETIHQNKDKCKRKLAKLVERFGPPREEMLLYALCKPTDFCHKWHNKFLDLYKATNCECHEIDPKVRYFCNETRQVLQCEMFQLGICKQDGTPHDEDPCDGVDLPTLSTLLLFVVWMLAY